MADYDDPRPSSQPTGSTEGAVGKDNLITLDRIMTAPTGTEITNRKGKVLTPMVDIVGEAQAIVQAAVDAVAADTIQNTDDIAELKAKNSVTVSDSAIELTQTSAELQTILDDSASVLKAVAISAGTTVENVMLATNKLDPVVGFIYDADEQVTYSVPDGAQGKFISSVVGGTLTASDGSIFYLYTASIDEDYTLGTFANLGDGEGLSLGDLVALKNAERLLVTTSFYDGWAGTKDGAEGGAKYQIMTTSEKDAAEFLNGYEGITHVQIRTTGYWACILKESLSLKALGAKPAVSFDSQACFHAYIGSLSDYDELDIDDNYTSSPITCNKNLIINGTGSVTAISNQSHIFMFEGTDSDNPLTHVGMLGKVKFFGNSFIISDAAFVMKWVSIPQIERLHVEYVNGWAVRLLNVFECRLENPFIRKVGAAGKGGIFIDDYDDNVIKNVNNVRIVGGTFGHVNGVHVYASENANADLIWIKDNKFEWDGGYEMHGADTSVIELKDVARCEISGNGFAYYKTDNADNKGGFDSLIRIGVAGVSNAGSVTIEKNTAFNCDTEYGVEANGGEVFVGENIATISGSEPLKNVFRSTDICRGPREWVSIASNGGNFTQDTGEQAPLLFSSVDLRQTVKHVLSRDEDSYAQTQQVTATSNVGSDIIIGDLYSLNEVKSLPVVDLTVITIVVRAKRTSTVSPTVRLDELNVNFTFTDSEFAYISQTTTIGAIRGLSRIRLLHQNASSGVVFDCVGFYL